MAMPCDNNVDQSHYLTYQQMNLINNARNITMDLALWSMFLINCIVRKDGCTEAVYQKLHRVALNTYQNMVIFYGPVISQKFIDLLTRHIIILKDLIEAIISNDQKTADNLYKRWYENADEVSTFFAKINPYWTKEQWNYFFNEYLQLTYEEIMAAAASDYGKGVEIFDRIRYHTILSGDYFSRGMMQALAIDPPFGLGPAKVGLTK